jgi:26S proteasome non-ATPase regulatory subunit 5
MEARYNCCKRIHKSLTQSTRVSADPAIAAKVRCQTFPLCFALVFVLLLYAKKIKKTMANVKLSFCVCVSCVQLEEAVGMGPYLHKKRVEAQPIVMTADRF